MASLRPDIFEAKKELGPFAWKSLREVNRLHTYLRSTERVLALSAGVYGGGGGLVALTDQRVLFVKDGWFSKTSQDFRIDRISSVEWQGHLLRGKLVIFGEGEEVIIEKVWNRSGSNIARLIRDKSGQAGFGGPSGYGAAPAATGPVGAQRGSSDDIMQRLERLEQMRSSLPRERYEALKDKILAGD